jgi:hypothetical protein
MAMPIGATFTLGEAPRWATDVDGNAADNAVQVQIDAQGFAGKMIVQTEIPMTAMGRVPKNTEPHPFPAFPLDIDAISTEYSQ